MALHEELALSEITRSASDALRMAVAREIARRQMDEIFLMAREMSARPRAHSCVITYDNYTGTYRVYTDNGTRNSWTEKLRLSHAQISLLRQCGVSEYDFMRGIRSDAFVQSQREWERICRIHNFAATDYRDGEIIALPAPVTQDSDFEAQVEMRIPAILFGAEGNEVLWRRQSETAATRLRAQAWLLEFLDAAQQQTWKENDYFCVRGSMTGTTYRVCRRSVYNVDRLANDKKTVEGRFCLQADTTLGKFPMADVWLAQKLLIETDEDKFLRVANYSPLPARPPLIDRDETEFIFGGRNTPADEVIDPDYSRWRNYISSPSGGPPTQYFATQYFDMPEHEANLIMQSNGDFYVNGARGVPGTLELYAVDGAPTRLRGRVYVNASFWTYENESGERMVDGHARIEALRALNARAWGVDWGNGQDRSVQPEQSNHE